MKVLKFEMQSCTSDSIAITALSCIVIIAVVSVSPFSLMIGCRNLSIVGGLIAAVAAFLTMWSPNIAFVIVVFGLFTGKSTTAKNIACDFKLMTV